MHALAKEHLEAGDAYEQCDLTQKTLIVDGKEVEARTRTTKKYVDKMGYVLVTKGEIGGMSTDKFLAYRENLAENIQAMDPAKITTTILDNFDGADMAIHMQIKMGFMMSNRSIINAFYFSEEDLDKGIYT